MSDSNYRQLVVWQRAMALVSAVYEVTKSFPSEERFGLAQQLRRAAVSIPSNIAEGRGRGTSRDYRHFLTTARGSLFEVETQIQIAGQLGYIEKETTEAFDQKIQSVLLPLGGLIHHLDQRPQIPKPKTRR